MIDKLKRDCIELLKPYFPGKSIEAVQRELGPKAVVKLASNENPLGPSPLAVKAIKARIKELSYYPEADCPELREALSKKLGLSTENIVSGNGSDEVMMQIASAFINPGDEVITSRSTFSIYEFVATLMDGKPVLVHLKDYTYDLESMLKFVGPKTKLVFIANPNNPTGTIVTAKEVDNFLSKLPQRVIVVLDEAYGQYVESSEYPETLSYVKQGKNVIVLRTFSKFYGLAGLRVGYGLAKKEIIDCLNRVRLPFNVSRVAQIAGAAALEDKEFEERSLNNNKEGKSYLYRELKKLGLEFIETEANFICVSLKQDAAPVLQKLIEAGVIVRSLASFEMPRFIRVTVGAPAENKKFIKALKKVI